MAFLRKKEKQILTFIKNNRTKVLLEFFRNHSAKIVVIMVAALVVAGNLRSGIQAEGGFLLNPDQKKNNKEKIQKRVQKYNAEEESLVSAPLALTDDKNEQDKENATELLMNDEEFLKKNELQFQALTATTPDTKELLSQGAEVAVYEVRQGDTLGKIAEKFDVSENTILWANDIDDPDKIAPGDKIFILPTSGVRHTVKEGDNLDKIAKKYKAKKEEILAFNGLPADGRVEKGAELIIPGGEIEQPTTPNTLLAPRDYASAGDGGPGRGPSIIDRNPKGGHRFPWGYCTWYVAQSKYVPWGGHAGTWLYRSKAFGVKTGKKPKKGAIIVTSESWYGHVGIVTKVKGNNVHIREMNYKGFGVESTRVISAKSRVIKGYIY